MAAGAELFSRASGIDMSVRSTEATQTAVKIHTSGAVASVGAMDLLTHDINGGAVASLKRASVVHPAEQDGETAAARMPQSAPRIRW
jgi:hypothetical protein